LQLKVQTILLGHSLKEINGRVFFVPVGPYDSVRFCIKNYTSMAVYTITRMHPLPTKLSRDIKTEWKKWLSKI
jgi:hypothetical protein